MENRKNTFIVRCGEVALKGMNKPYFERMLLERIRKNLKRFDGAEANRSEGLIFVKVPDIYDSEEVINELSRVFGVSSVSSAWETESEIDEICKKAGE